MKKILLCLDKNQFCPFNYNQKWTEAMKSMGYNSGNNVFQFSLQKILTDENFILDIDTNFLNNTKEFLKHIDFINNNYDYCVTSPANVIGVWAKETALPRWTNAISKVKIPFIFVGVGAQSNYEYSFDFINDIRKESYEFIKAILATGGQVGVRGFFTGEILKNLGFKESIDFEVIGCPSLFMNGKDIHININKTLTEEELVPLFNGFPCWFNPSFHKYFFKYLKSNYICQDELYRLLYSPKSALLKDLNYIRSGLFEDLIINNRVHLFCDFLSWINYIKENKFNFSFGTRIHGNIVSLLAGIPAFIDSVDSRTREMSEFFYIPNKMMSNNLVDPFDLYQECDYAKFNKEFNIKFDNFKEFFNRNGLPCLENLNYINNIVKNFDFKYEPSKTNIKDIIKIKQKYNVQKTKPWSCRILRKSFISRLLPK